MNGSKCKLERVVLRPEEKISVRVHEVAESRACVTSLGDWKIERPWISDLAAVIVRKHGAGADDVQRTKKEGRENESENMPATGGPGFNLWLRVHAYGNLRKKQAARKMSSPSP